MATPSLPQSAETPQTYTIKEFQLLVRDKPAIPAEIQPFVGAPFTCSVEIFRRFQGLATMPVPLVPLNQIGRTGPLDPPMTRGTTSTGPGSG